MIRALGGAMLFCGCAYCGWLAARRLSVRVQVIRQMLTAVQIAQRELRFALTSVPRLLLLLQQQSGEPLRGFFRRCCEGIRSLERQSLDELWQSVLTQSALPAGKEELRVFSQLGKVLGRYDSSGQETFFIYAAETLEGCLEAAEEERKRMGKVYHVLGVAAGGFLLVLLL